jgi:hypothetical protein
MSSALPNASQASMSTSHPVKTRAGTLSTSPMITAPVDRDRTPSQTLAPGAATSLRSTEGGSWGGTTGFPRL